MHVRKFTMILLLAATLTAAPLTSANADIIRTNSPAVTWAEHSYESSDGTRLRFIEQGEGTPIVLIHGLGSSAQAWFNIGAAQILSETNRVIALDMRGHGQSGVSPEGSDATMIQDVIALLDELGIEKAHIVGYSMGGATTAGLLREAPERFLAASILGIGTAETDEWQGQSPLDPEIPASQERPTNLPRPTIPAGAPSPTQAVDLTTIDFPVLSIIGSYDMPNSKTFRMWRELHDFARIVIPERNHGAASRDPRFVAALVRFITAHNGPAVEFSEMLPTDAELLEIRGP